MRIVCYYEQIDDPPVNDNEALIELWKMSWAKHGWDPKVVGINLARSHSLYQEYSKAVSFHPTINNRRYEMTCWVRHLAYDLSGATVFSDFDLINYGWGPISDDRIKSKIHSYFHAALFSLNRQYGYEWLLRAMMGDPKPEIVNGCEHVSDMTAMMSLSEINRTMDAVDYGQTGWETASMVHYGNGPFGQKEKAKRIQQIRPI